MPAVGQSNAVSPRYKTERPFRLWTALAAMMGMLLLVDSPAPAPPTPSLTPPLEERLSQAALRGDLALLRAIWSQQNTHPQFANTRFALGAALCGAATCWQP